MQGILIRSARDHIFLGYMLRGIKEEKSKYKIIQEYKEEMEDLREMSALYRKFNDMYREVKTIKSV